MSEDLEEEFRSEFQIIDFIRQNCYSPYRVEFSLAGDLRPGG